MNSKKHLVSFFAGFFCMLAATISFAATPEFGKASYYHDKFEGKKTASGQAYRKDQYTCAHKTLKFGTTVRVTRLDDGRSVDVRVNDRGPYSEGYLVDLSRVAAEDIGLIKDGVTKVKLEVVEKEVVPTKPVTLKPVSKTEKAAPATTTTKQVAKPAKGTETSATAKPATMPQLVRPVSSSKGTTTAKGASKVPPPQVQKLSLLENATYKVDMSKAEQKGFAVQLFSFSSLDAAMTELNKMQKNYKGKTLLQTATDGSCKILIGPYPNRKAAEAAQKAATKKGHSKCYVIDLQQDSK
jgi:rare lipoprotein A